jgi:xanthosine utilization system XapX-like protein
MAALSELLGRLPAPLVVAILALAFIQVGLQIFGLVDLVRRPWVPGGRKWVWALVIVAGNLVGAVVYLALGRRPAPPVDQRGNEDDESRQRALDRVYRGQ